MTDKFDRDLADQFRKLDQPIQIDANELTSRLASIRNQRRVHKSRNRMVAVVALGCIAFFGVAIQLLLNGGDHASVTTNANDDDWKPISLTDFEFPNDSVSQAAELSRLQAELDALKRESNAQQLTLVRESISRTMFSNDSTLSLYE